MPLVEDEHPNREGHADGEVNYSVEAVHSIVRILCPIHSGDDDRRAKKHLQVEFEHRSNQDMPSQPVSKLVIWSVAYENEPIDPLRLRSLPLSSSLHRKFQGSSKDKPDYCDVAQYEDGSHILSEVARVVACELEVLVVRVGVAEVEDERVEEENRDKIEISHVNKRL